MPGIRTPALDLGERLVTGGLIGANQLELARREQKRRGGALGKLLIELGFVSVEGLSNFVAREAQARLVDLNRMVIDRTTLELVPLELCRKFRVLPVEQYNGSLTVAMADPLNVLAIDTLSQVTGLHIDVVTTTEQDILNILDQLQPGGGSIDESIDKIIQEEVEEAQMDTRTETPTATPTAEEDEAPVIRLVSQIIARAVNLGASDIHFAPEEKLMRTRIRIDGILHPDVLIPKSLQSPVTSRVKILAGMDVAENRLPQDGRATVFVGRREINLRVSSLPTTHGENMVVRILNPTSSVLTIASLGLEADDERRLRAAVDRPHGVVIVTGPTGSGKSTTLYAILREVASSEWSVFTLEDPVEYAMTGIRQTQVKEDIGLTFGTGLRTLLRQDPDIILVGETRDTETAQLMVRAALTGHLVFTTLHTNDAPGAIPRLLDMGVEPYLLPASLIGVLAQRLVRRVCPQCREPLEHPETVLETLKVEPPPGPKLALYQGKGCGMCKGSGYKGRLAVFELMLLDHRFHDPIVRRSGAPEFMRLAREGGMKTMFEDGLRRAIQGHTTIEEVLRVTRME